MARAPRIAAIVEDQTREDRRRPESGELALNSPLGKICLDGIEEVVLEDWHALAPVDLEMIGGLANIEAVLQDMRERAGHEALGGDDPAVRQFPRSWPDAVPVE